MHFLSSLLLDLCKSLDYGNLRRGRHGIDQEIDDGDLVVDDCGLGARFIFDVECDRLDSIFSHCFLLLWFADKRVELVISW